MEKNRIENKADFLQITEIHNQAFKGIEESQIVTNLRKNKNLKLSLVYENDGILVGHIAYSLIKNNNDIVIGMGLAPLSVLPSHQNKGIGSKLVKYGNYQVKKMGFNQIFVLGDPKYYSRFGFEKAKKYNYFSDFDLKGNHFMVFGKKIKEPFKINVFYSNEFKL